MLCNKINKVTDRDFVLNLQNDVKKKWKKIHGWENKIKKTKVKQEKMENLIREIRFPSERNEMEQNFENLQNEIELYKSKVGILKKSRAGVKVSYLHMKQKQNECKKYLKELSEQAKDLGVTSPIKAENTEFEQLQRRLRVSTEKSKVDKKLLSSKIKALEKELKSSKDREKTLENLVIQSNSLNKSRQVSLVDLKSASSQIPRKLISIKSHSNLSFNKKLH